MSECVRLVEPAHINVKQSTQKMNFKHLYLDISRNFMILLPMTDSREKFATQVDTAILENVRGLAKDEGRQIQAMVDEAFADLIEKYRQTRPRPHVMEAYNRSLGKYDALYKKLAK